MEERQTIQIDKEDVKKLEKFKVHPNQPYWEIIKKLINEKESKHGNRTK